jgi:acyl homoserine lactone synthase
MQTISSDSQEFTPEFEVAVASYRHKIFIERLGWQLPVQNGLERDQFDRPDTLYVVARDDNGEICGCARLLPTVRPYLLSEVFPQLMNGLPPPASHDVWELSRFAVVNLNRGANDSDHQARATRELLAAATRVVRQQGGQRLITVSPLGIERLLHRMGVHAHRAGPPVLVDGKPVFACWIEIDEQTCRALGLSLPKSDLPERAH